MESYGMQLPSFKLQLATKAVSLVLLMGVLAAVILVYATSEMRRIDSEYQALIRTEARSAILISNAAIDLSEATGSVYAMLRGAPHEPTQPASQELARRLAQFNRRIAEVRRISPDKSQALDAIDAQSPRLVAAATRVVQALGASDTQEALQRVEDALQPEVLRMRFQIGLILEGSNQAFGRASGRLAQAADRTIWTTVIAVSLSLALVIALSIWFVVIGISRPIVRLASAMERLSHREYDAPALVVKGQDELATMARSLQAFKESMQRADALARQIIEAARARQLHAQLEDLASGIPGSLFQFHADAAGNRRYRFLSKKTADLLGRTVSELQALNLPVQDRRSPRQESHLDLRSLVAASVRTLDPLDFDMLLTRGGQATWIRTIAAAHRAPDGGAVFNGVAYDVTYIRQQAQALEQAKRAAEDTAREKSALLASMSQEIRTPLNAILDMAQRALDAPLPTVQASRMQQILRSGDHLQHIVQHILHLSKLEGGHVALEVSAFATAELLVQVGELCRPSAEAAGVALGVACDPAVPPLVWGDPFRIRQILVSFVSHALHAAQAGRVDIAAAVQANDAQGLALRFEVLDESDALDETGLARLVQPLGRPAMAARQLSDSTAWALGLAISGRLAQLMGGSAGACKRPGGGTCFWLTVRVQQRAPDLAASTPGAGR